MRKISLGLGFAALVASQAFWVGSTAYAAESLAPTASNLQLAAAEVLDVSAIRREQRARGGEVELLWEDFSDAAFPPAGWSRHLLGAGTVSAQWARDTAQFSSAPASAKRNWGSGYQDDWLVTPVVELGPGTNTLYFIDAGQWMEDYTYGGVWLSNGSCDPADGDFVELAEIDDTPGSSSAIVWRSEPVAIDLSSYAEQDVCLAFVYQGDFGPTWWIDDVHVTNGDPLPPAQIGVDPAALAITVEYDEAESQNVSVMNLADAGSQDLEFTTTITRLVDGDTELTQSNSMSIVNSLGICGSGNPQTSTADNSFWRVFDLADHGITSDFSVTSIETGIGFNTASNAQTLNVYTVDGDFELANLTLLGSAGYTVAPADQATVIEVNFDLPVTVPAGSIMAIEQHIPASGGAYRAHVAANELGQTGDTYWSSTDCGPDYFEPQSIVDAVSAPAELSWVLAVHGHEDDGSIVPTVTVVPDTGAIAGDSFLDLTVTADATGVVPESRALYEYVMTIDSNDPVTPAVQIPVNVNVISGGGGGGDPEIDVDPASLSASVAEGDTGTDTLTIANTAAPGSDALVWNIESEPAMAGSGVPERLGTPAGISRSADQQAQLIANEAARGSIVADGGFEAGSPNPFWDEASSNYGTLLCTIADCGTGTGTGPRTGTWWAWFGGIASAEIGYARQDVTIPSTNSATLSFWTEQVVCSGSADDFLQVSLDGDVLWTTTAADPSCGSLGYREISLDISAYAGGTHTLEFYSELQGGATSNFFVDDVAITTDAAPPAVCDAPSGLSWLSLSSANGSTDAGDSVQIDVTYDATGLAAGTYNGNLCVTSNDPANPLVIVPVALDVTTGGGPVGDPAISLDATSFSFSVDADDSDSSDLTITNSGAAGSTLDWSIAEAAAASVAGNAGRSVVLGQSIALDPSASLSRSGLPAGLSGQPISARGGSIVLSQNSSTAPLSANTVACFNSDQGWTRENAFLRRFYFDEHPGLEGGAEITSVDVSVETAAGGDTLLTVELYTLPSSTPVDTIPALGTLTLIGSATANVPDGTAVTSINVPISGTVADTANFDLVVAVHAPDYDGQPGHRFFPGSNSAGETHPGFLMSATCGAPTPASYAGLGFPDVHLILTANAEPLGPVGCDAPEDIPWLSVGTTSGSLAAGASDVSSIGVDATGLAGGTYEAKLCVTSNDPANPLIEVPVSMTVVGVGDPQISVDPASVDLVAAVDGATSGSLTIANLGDGYLDWDLDNPPLLGRGSSVLLDEDFDGSFPPAGWTVDTPVGACSWARSDDYLLSGFTGTGLGAAMDADDCGSSGGNYVTRLVTPALDLSNITNASLTFDLAYRHVVSPNFRVQASSDGGATWADVATYPATVGYATPVPQTVDLSDYDGEANVQLRFDWESGWTWWAYVDNVVVSGESSGASCSGISDIGWLSATPASGSIASGNDELVTLDVDATGLAVGSYEEVLCVHSNDPANPVIDVPVNLTVAASSGDGDLVVTPGVVNIEAPVGQGASAVMTLDNEGSSALDWVVIPEVVSLISEDFEGAFPPAGWTVDDNGSAPCPWFHTDGSDLLGFVTGGTGMGAGVNADGCGSGQTYDTSLTSPVIDLDGYDQASLTYDVSFRNFLSSTDLSLEVSTDAGATWQVIKLYTANTGYNGAPVTEEFDLSAYSGQQIQLRWQWTSGWTYWAWVDNIEVRARDGAAWPLSCWDSDVEWLDVMPTSGTIAAAGSQSISLAVADTTEPGAYSTELCFAHNSGGPTEMVVVPVDVTVTAPVITVDPMSISAAADPGDSVSETLTIGNTGDGDLVYTLDEAPAGMSNPRAHFPAVPRSFPEAFGRSAASVLAERISDYELSKLMESADAAGSTERRVNAFSRGGFQVPAYSNTGWANTDYVTLDAMDPSSLTSIVDPQVNTIYAATFLDNDFSRQFFIAGTPGTGAVLGLGDYGFLDTATGEATVLGTVSNTPAGGNWTSAAQDPTTGTVYAVANSASGNMLFTVDPATGVTTQVGPITGAQLVVAIAISPDGLMYGLDIADDVLIAIDKTTGAMSVIGPVGHDANFAQDMDFDQSTGILYWAGYFGGGNSRMMTIDTSTGAATEIAPIANGAELLSFSIAVSGSNCSAPADVPWLSLDSAGGTIPAGGADHSIGVTLDAAGLSDGVYEASICVRSNDPSRALVEVPVEFVVGEPALGTDLALSLFSVPGTVNAGGDVSLIATVANFGPHPATDVVVALELPAEFSFLSGRVIEGAGDWTCSAVDSDVTCELTAGVVPVGEFATVLRVDVGVDADAEDGTVQTVGVVSNAGGDPNPVNDTATADTTIIGAPGDLIFANGFEEPIAACEPLQLLTDPSLEATDPGTYLNPHWQDFSSNYGGVLCDVVGCGDGAGTAGARTGNFWAWMGGTSNPETSWLEQTVTIPNSPERHLNFWMWMGSVESSSQLEVKVDGNVVASYPTVLESGYVQRSVDLSDYADGGSHTIRFELVLPGGGNVNASLDDITLECEAP